jgi:hypothetical protein
MLWLSLALAADWPTHSLVSLEVGPDLTHPNLSLPPRPYDPAVAIPSSPTGGPGLAAFAEPGLARMDAAGFRAPYLPVVVIPGQADAFPILWAPVRPGAEGAPMAYSESRVTLGGLTFPGFGTRGALFGNTTMHPLAKTEEAWQAGGERRKRLLGWLGTNTLHEVVHAVQANHTDPGTSTRPWVNEGVADGLGAYLATAQLPDHPSLHENWMHQRSFTRSLHDDPNKGYRAGAWWKYLAEAWEAPGRDGLTLFPGIVGLKDADHASDAAAYAALDKVIRARTGRPMNLVFAEFLTEYASYGGHRYTWYYEKAEKGWGRRDVTEERWLKAVFGGCSTVTVKPGDVQVVPLSLAPVAGACVTVDWSGFRSTSLQLHAVGSGSGLDGIQIGEAVTKRVRRTPIPETCWGVTKKLEGRLALGPEAKCMLNRQTVEVGGKDVALFVLGEPLLGAGKTTFVVSNAADAIGRTKKVDLQLVVGAADAKAAVAAASAAKGLRSGPAPGAGTSSLSPMEEVERPLQHGLTNVRGTVHLMAMGPDRAFIDGMPAFAQDRATQFAPGGQDGGKGVMVRTREYMAVVMADGQGSMILKDPATMGGMRPPVASVGSELEAVGGDCGYQLDVVTTVLDDSPFRRRVRLEADLFDPMRLMGAGEPGCAAMKAAWVERATVELTLPLPGLYDAAPVRRVVGPTQRRIDEAFGIGPFFGGIAASESLRVDGPADLAALEGMSGPPPAPPPSGPSAPPEPPPPPPPSRPAGTELDAVCQELGRSGVFAQPIPMVVDAALQAAEAQGCLCTLKAMEARGEGMFGAAARTRLAAVSCP